MAENETIRQSNDGSGGAYRAYLLRCWQEDVGRGTPWRFTLVGVGEGHAPKGFASLKDLFSYLRAELESNFAKDNL